jgi:hypothetical protein
MPTNTLTIWMNFNRLKGKNSEFSQRVFTALHTTLITQRFSWQKGNSPKTNKKGSNAGMCFSGYKKMPLPTTNKESNGGMCFSGYRKDAHPPPHITLPHHTPPNPTTHF